MMPARTQLAHLPRPAIDTARDSVQPPQWVFDMLQQPRFGWQPDRKGVHVVEGDDFALLSASIHDARAMNPRSLEQAVIDLYGELLGCIDQRDASRLVRIWNHIPAIHDPMEPGRDRYMVFNAGRYQAYAARYGGPAAFDRDVATASGIGHRGRDLVVHCLSYRGQAIPVTNPRQIAPHRYSSRYGPLPPCFARAMVLGDLNLILVGGTASIVGEESLHLGNLEMQMQETLRNLSSVVQAARQGQNKGGAHEDLLHRFHDVRVYYPRAADGDNLSAMAVAAFGEACRIEMRRADLCRSELLVEIEGVARLSD